MNNNNSKQPPSRSRVGDGKKKMKKVDFKKILIGLAAVSIMSAFVGFNSPTNKQQTPESSAPVTVDKTLLEKYDTCRQVEPEDNKVGISIVSLTKKNDNSFFVQWEWASNINDAFIAVRIYYIDANDFSNYKNAFSSVFSGNLGELKKMTVTLDRPAEAIIIYFRGIDASIPNSEAFRTSSLFFMADLGVSPKLLEKTPRYAGDLFKEIDEKEK
jgi:hypothetical protein